MFWGITLESGKKYTQVLQRSFCVTMAALGFENPSNDCVYVVAEVNNAQHVLCSLQAGKVPQQALNLSFTEGEHVSFFIEGGGQVHLTGYLTLDEEEDSDLSDSDESNSDENETNGDMMTHDTNGLQSNHVNQNGGTNEVSDISWQGILSGSQEKDVSNTSDGQHINGNHSATNRLKDTPNETLSVNENIDNEYNDYISPITNVQRLNCNSDNDEKTTPSSDGSDLISKLPVEDEEPDSMPTSMKKKKLDATNSSRDEIRKENSSSDDSDTKYMLVEEKKLVAKRKRSTESTENSTTAGKKSRGKSENTKRTGKTVERKAKSKPETNKKTDSNTKKKATTKPEATKKGTSKSKKAINVRKSK